MHSSFWVFRFLGILQYFWSNPKPNSCQALNNVLAKITKALKLFWAKYIFICSSSWRFFCTSRGAKCIHHSAPLLSQWPTSHFLPSFWFLWCTTTVKNTASFSYFCFFNPPFLFPFPLWLKLPGKQPTKTRCLILQTSHIPWGLCPEPWCHISCRENTIGQVKQ